jgi:hypothetical protein
MIEHLQLGVGLWEQSLDSRPDYMDRAGSSLFRFNSYTMHVTAFFIHMACT